MKVIVTGGAGFIGSHTVDRLIAQGADVLVLDDLSSGRQENVNQAAGFVKMDITSGQLSEIFDRFRPDYVIHLAGQVSVALSASDPVRDSMTNIVGTVNLLENCRRCQVKKVVYASSAAVYGNPEEEVVSEGTPTAPLSFYGVSKLTPEYYLRVFNHLYGQKYTVLRYANVYGPRQNSHGEGGVIAIFSALSVSGQNPTIFGDGEQTRDFIYVEDVAAANIKALAAGDMSCLNIGTGKGTSVNQLLALTCQITGADLKPTYAQAREGDIRHSRMDISKTMAALAWKPSLSLHEGLVKTLDYYRQSLT